jgi:hypothetical protein
LKFWDVNLTVFIEKRRVVESFLRVLLKLFCCCSLEEGGFVRFVGVKAFELERPYNSFNIRQKTWFTVEQKELKRMAVVLQELGMSYTEALEVVNEMAKDVNSARKLWRDGYKSKLIKIAITLITFPEPTPISETVGAAFLAAGLVQNQIKKSTLHVEDVYKTFQDVNNDILKIRQFRR